MSILSENQVVHLIEDFGVSFNGSTYFVDAEMTVSYVPSSFDSDEEFDAYINNVLVVHALNDDNEPVAQISVEFQKAINEAFSDFYEVKRPDKLYDICHEYEFG